MNINELRIGNAVQLPNSIDTVYEIRCDSIITLSPYKWKINPESVNPVPLSALNLLTSLSFEHNGHANDGSFIFRTDVWNGTKAVIDDVHIIVIEIVKGFWNVQIERNGVVLCSLDISFVHQLQNIVFVALNKELVYKAI